VPAAVITSYLQTNEQPFHALLESRQKGGEFVHIATQSRSLAGHVKDRARVTWAHRGHRRLRRPRLRRPRKKSNKPIAPPFIWPEEGRELSLPPPALGGLVQFPVPPLSNEFSSCPVANRPPSSPEHGRHHRGSAPEGLGSCSQHLPAHRPGWQAVVGQDGQAVTVGVHPSARETTLEVSHARSSVIRRKGLPRISYLALMCCTPSQPLPGGCALYSRQRLSISLAGRSSGRICSTCSNSWAAQFHS
jgi:hypothetical protein